MPSYHSLALRSLAVFALGSVGLHAQITIGSTTSNLNAALNSSASFGENFTAPLGNATLATFAAELDAANSSGVATFTAYVFAWNRVSTALGAQVWTGTTSVSGTSPQLVTFDVATALTGGSQYIFVLSDSSDTSGNTRFSSSSTYPLGNFIQFQTDTPTPGLVESNSFSADDLAFSASFNAFSPSFNSVVLTAVPESKTLIFGGLALCAGLAFWYSRFGRRAIDAGVLPVVG